ncbi:hypothetical protein KHA94_09630 [Bacillus sp. FJAT-49705]|uniref:Uncharacterized protein n=1 Tax=Cytobacillus citreus TaxID=2833586 RepID=A0ABS5NRK6_9BACI|nr:hypothetical protein [Cytobacillus citreus]MBS4190449.1 hypothetical protein [Cytobacillus citreus]
MIKPSCCNGFIYANVTYAPYLEAEEGWRQDNSIYFQQLMYDGIGDEWDVH